jgi:hypothetical protein
MALIKCSECNQNVSDKARSCPHCGNPINVNLILHTDTPTTVVNINESKIKPYSLKKALRDFIIGGVIFSIIAIIFFAFSPELIQTTQKFIPNFSQDISQIVDSELPKPPETDPFAVQTNSDGSKIYPVQHNNLWGHEFYTAKIDQSGSIDIGSEPKQSIAKLFNSIDFPPALSKNLIIALIDPTMVKPNDRLNIPWAPGELSIELQPEYGTYQDVWGGSVIALNNLTGFDRIVLMHEFGHLIGNRLTDEEWQEYYKLRAIPSNTPRSSDNWALSPQEDFAEVYKAVYKSAVVAVWEERGWSIQTNFGILMPTGLNMMDIMTPCRELYRAGRDSDPKLQECRRKNNGPV